MRKALLPLALFALFGATVAPLPALACSCVPANRVDLDKFVARVPVFFWGRAVSQRVEETERIYVFEIAGAKGALPARVRLRTRRSSAACGATFPMNKPILVGAAVNRGILTTGSCTQYVIRVRQAEILRRLRRCRPFGGCP
jgi:hypothetical protein